MEAIVASVRQVLQEAGLEANASLVVAASGGVDSTVLLDVLDGLGYRLHVAHLDHALRPDSAADSRFVVAEAKAARAMPCSVERRDVGRTPEPRVCRWRKQVGGSAMLFSTKSPTGSGLSSSPWDITPTTKPRPCSCVCCAAAVPLA